MGLTLDRLCKDPARLRGISYDPCAVINDHAQTYKRIYTPPQPKPIKLTGSGSDKIEALTRWAEKKISFYQRVQA